MYWNANRYPSRDDPVFFAMCQWRTDAWEAWSDTVEYVPVLVHDFHKMRHFSSWSKRGGEPELGKPSANSSTIFLQICSWIRDCAVARLRQWLVVIVPAAIASSTSLVTHQGFSSHWCHYREIRSSDWRYFLRFSPPVLVCALMAFAWAKRRARLGNDL